MSEQSISPRYEKRAPSAQTIVDIFKGSWKSKLPGGLASGQSDLWEDTRPHWAEASIPGGFAGKTVLEFGPFEAYQTHALVRAGAKEIVSVEGNSINYLKCLCLKEVFGMNAVRLQHGDFVQFLVEDARRFDVCWASGVLYHLQDPIRFIELVTNRVDHVYFWTHYFDDSILQLRNGQQHHFLPDRNTRRVVDERFITLHARSYMIPDYEHRIPMYWEGGQEQITYWLEREDIFWLLERAGFAITATQFDNNHVEGLPAISFLASRVK